MVLTLLRDGFVVEFEILTLNVQFQVEYHVTHRIEKLTLLQSPRFRANPSRIHRDIETCRLRDGCNVVEKVLREGFVQIRREFTEILTETCSFSGGFVTPHSDRLEKLTLVREVFRASVENSPSIQNGAVFRNMGLLDLIRSSR